jgi:hypothetical protein
MHSVSLSISVGSRAPCLVWEGGCKLDRQSVADLACAIDGARDIVMASSASIIFFFNVVCVNPLRSTLGHGISFHFPPELRAAAVSL